MRSTRILAGIEILALIFICRRVAAQEVPDSSAVRYVLPPVVVTADRMEEPLDRVSSSVTIVTSRDIELQQARSIDEALRSVPGLHIVRSGSPVGSNSKRRLTSPVGTGSGELTRNHSLPR